MGAVAFSLEGKVLVIAQQNGIVRLFDIQKMPTKWNAG